MKHDLTMVIMHKLARLDALGKEVTFEWVPAHMGIPGNECADSLAKAATLLAPPGIQATQSLAASRNLEFRDNIKQVSAVPRLCLPSLTVAKEWSRRRHCRVMNAFVCGLQVCPRRNFLIGRARTPECDCGAENGDAVHVLLSCPLFAEERRDLSKIMETRGWRQLHLYKICVDRDVEAAAAKVLTAARARFVRE